MFASSPCNQHTGYVQLRNESRVYLPNPDDKDCQALIPKFAAVSPNFNSSKNEPMKFNLTYNQQYGSFHVVIPVAKAADLLQYSVSLTFAELRDKNGTLIYESATVSDYFQVADPRPPSASLNLTAPDWVSAKRSQRSAVFDGG